MGKADAWAAYERLVKEDRESNYLYLYIYIYMRIMNRAILIIILKMGKELRLSSDCSFN